MNLQGNLWLTDNSMPHNSPMRLFWLTINIRKNVPFIFLIIFKGLRKKQVPQSNLCENKPCFNYIRFIKLLSLEDIQSKLLFKVTTRLIYKNIYSLPTLKRSKIQVKGEGEVRRKRSWKQKEKKEILKRPHSLCLDARAKLFRTPLWKKHGDIPFYLLQSTRRHTMTRHLMTR